MRGKTSDLVKSGLWGYAESMGVQLTQDQAHDAVRVYRQKYREVVQYWRDLEDTVTSLVYTDERAAATFGVVKFELLPRKLLRVKLPSGRSLHYIKPEILNAQLSYETELSPSKVRGMRRLYGSLLTENLVQAIARDVLAVGMVRAADAGFEIVGHTHDELLAVEPTAKAPANLELLMALMTAEIPWCKDLPLKAEGWEGEVYRK
jgi:DNA polymerase